MTLKHKPIYAGHCVVVAQYISPPISGRYGCLGEAGVRIMSPSAAAAGQQVSDVHLCLNVADAQALSAYFAALSRELLGVPA